jgi:hypothetical protein
MPDETVDVRFAADLDTWVISGGPPGPAGVASWEAAGVYWAVDRVVPERLVRCEVDAALTDRGRQLVELLFGDVLSDGTHPLAGSPVVRRSAGWLAVALDELGPDDDPSLLLADAFVLARRVGIDDLLPGFDLDTVETVLDALDPAFLDALQAEDRVTFDLLRASSAIVRADDRPVDQRFVRPALDAPILTFAGGTDDVSVWCQGIPVGAVVDVRTRLLRGRRRILVQVRVGDRPIDELYVQTLRGREVVGTTRCEPTDHPGQLQGELDWLRAGADAVRLVVAPDLPPPPTLGWAAEAVHWGREAARLARRGDPTASLLWARTALSWTAADEPALAAEAGRRRDVAEIAASPFVRDRPATRAVLENLVSAGRRTAELADTAQLAGFVDLAARARLASAEARLGEGRATVALVEAALAQRDFGRRGDVAGAGRAAEVAEAAQR